MAPRVAMATVRPSAAFDATWAGVLGVVCKATMCYDRTMATSNNSRLYVRNVAGMGRGVFARQRIPKGEVIETCPVIPLSEADETKLSQTVLDKYMFAWGEAPRRSCIALGYGSLYNHSSTPNAVACRILSRAEIEIVAIRNIDAEEQILTDYDWDDEEYDFPREHE
jgi:uncharacterized protein